MGVTALGLSDGIGEGGPRLEGLWTPGGQALSVEGRGLHGNGSQCSQIEREVKGIPGRGHRLSKGRRHELAAVVWVAAISASSPHSPAYGRVLPALAQRLAFPSIPRGLWILRFPVRGRHMNCGSQELQGREVQRERERVLGRFTGRQGGRWAAALSRWVPEGQAGAWVPGGGPGSHPDPRRQETSLVSQRFPSG